MRRRRKNPGGGMLLLVGGAVAAVVVGVLVLAPKSSAALPAKVPAPAPPVVDDLTQRKNAWVRRINFLACIADAQGHPDQGGALRIQAILISDGVQPPPDMLPPIFVGSAGGCVE